MGVRGKACRYQRMNRVLVVYRVYIMHSRRYGILVPWCESELKGNPLLIAEDVPVVSVVERCMAPLRNTIFHKGCLLFGLFRECLRHLIQHNLPRYPEGAHPLLDLFANVFDMLFGITFPASYFRL